MIIKVLRVSLFDRPIGRLFLYGDVCRFVADVGLGADAREPVLSLSMRAADPAAQMALWADIKNPLFNAQGGRLPAFFQNLLPEGVLRKHIAALRNCQENDHFELLAACGNDLPGAVRVRYQETTPLDLQRLVTQGQDALEPTVIELPMDEAISVSGMQPKLALVRVGQRYVHRTKTSKGVRVIAKLPVVGQPFMPRLEVTALALAHAAGVDVCEAKLELLSSIDALHDYNLPQEPEFLAVTRFDRAGAAHLHFEDFAQILGKEPSAKYTGSYLDMARVMMAVPGLGEPAVLELVRRIVVNELLGNPDGHLKNYGVLYAAGPNGLHASFAPAFDIVPYAISQGIQGHAMHLVPRGPSKPREGSRKQQLLTPATVREFAALAGMPEFKVRKAIETTCVLAVARWPAIIHSSGLPLPWVHKLLERLDNQPLIRSSIRPASKLRPAAWTAPV